MSAAEMFDCQEHPMPRVKQTEEVPMSKIAELDDQRKALKKEAPGDAYPRGGNSAEENARLDPAQ